MILSPACTTDTREGEPNRSSTDLPLADAETQRALGILLGEIWQRSRSTHAQRVGLMESAYHALAAGSLGPQLRKEAVHEAHKLAGGLGSFGLPAASEAARELEQFWRTVGGDQRTGHLRQRQVPAVLAFLRREMDCDFPAGFHQPPITPSSALAGRAADRGPIGATETVDIVLIEDDAPTAELLIAQCQVLGFDIRWFGDGDVALAALAGSSPELVARVILLDYDLPHSDGLEVLRSLGSQGVLDTTRVIMLTAAAQPELIARAINAGVHGYVGKPYRWSTLLDRIDECIGHTPALFVLGPLRR